MERKKNLITQRRAASKLYGENVENLCMWKVASEKKPLLIFCAMVFARVFFLTSSETTTTTRGKIFSGFYHERIENETGKRVV